jgi:hypothetical protein
MPWLGARLDGHVWERVPQVGFWFGIWLGSGGLDGLEACRAGGLGLSERVGG